jgi:hypothetical protein
MTPADILEAGAFAAIALCLGYLLLDWLTTRLMDALEFMSQYE